MNTTHEASASLTAKSTFSTPRSVIVLSIAASIVTMLLKFGAYFLTGSVSLLSDAAESSVNLIAALVAFGALTVVARPADRAHNYGHDKAEYFSSGVEGALILVAATTIIYTAVKRFLNPVPLTDLGLGPGHLTDRFRHQLRRLTLHAPLGQTVRQHHAGSRRPPPHDRCLDVRRCGRCADSGHVRPAEAGPSSTPSSP